MLLPEARACKCVNRRHEGACHAAQSLGSTLPGRPPGSMTDVYVRINT